MTLRQWTSWKGWFYRIILPGLRALGPDLGDSALAALGRVSHSAWPPRRSVIERATLRARSLLGFELAPRVFARRLAEDTARFAARDLPLDGLDDGAFHARYAVRGEGALMEALDSRCGVVLVGAHLGAYIAAIHWLSRMGVPLRTLIQRPQHVSRTLQGVFDQRQGLLPQAAMHLRRDLAPSIAAERILQARSALRLGMAVYLCGDIPWSSGRPGKLVGENQRLLSLWADLAAATGAYVVPVFALHRQAGRVELTFDAPWTVQPGGEQPAVARYLSRLSEIIRAEPEQAVAFWTWPGYGDAPQHDWAEAVPPRTRLRKSPVMATAAR